MSDEQKATNDARPIEAWAVVELMGHVTLAGRVTEENHFGSVLGRIDIPGRDGTFKTQFFHGSSIYRLTPCTEELARVVAEREQSTPMFLWSIPRTALPAPQPHDVDDDQDDDDDDQDDETEPLF